MIINKKVSSSLKDVIIKLLIIILLLLIIKILIFMIIFHLNEKKTINNKEKNIFHLKIIVNDEYEKKSCKQYKYKC